MKVALFDLDGVIIDTEPGYTAFWKQIGIDYFPENENFAQSLKGQTLKYIFEKFFFNDMDAQQEIRRRLRHYEEFMEFPFIPGVIDFINGLRERGVKMAIVTSSDREKMEHLYKSVPDFKNWFDGICTAENVQHSKPAPDCYLAAAESFGVSPHECVVFEDSMNGLLAAKASGAYVVGVATSLPQNEMDGFCDRVIPDFVSNNHQLLDLFTD